jgi:putative membrane protein
METIQKPKPIAGLSDYLAAERTVLAWIRTGLSLMGFGFVVARFGLFLQELQFAQQIVPTRNFGVSLWFGTALIASGVLVCVSGGLRHLRLVRSLDRGDIALTHSAGPALAVALFLSLVGLGMTIYLVSIRNSNLPKTHPMQERSMATPNDRHR